MNVLRSCAYCGGQWQGYASPLMDGLFFCPKHLRAMYYGFDPQPEDIVRMIQGPQLDYVVIARAGLMVTLRRLGAADYTMFQIGIANLWPRDVHTSIQRGLEMLRRERDSRS